MTRRSFSTASHSPKPEMRAPDSALREIRRSIVHWSPGDGPDYPWRDPGVPPWQGLLAELMLQRTRASQAAAVFDAFRTRISNPEDLAQVTDDQLIEIFRPLGLHWRGAMLVDLCREIQRRGGELIPEHSELRKLPGVGDYAAAATLTFHLNVRAVLLDSNIVRMVCRVLGQPFGPETRRKRWMRQTIDALVPDSDHREFNLKLLDLSMLVCRPRNPHCDECPLSHLCSTFNRTTGGPVAAERLE